MDQAPLLNLLAPALTAHEAASAGAGAPTVAPRARRAPWWRAVRRLRSRWVPGHQVPGRQVPAAADGSEVGSAVGVGRAPGPTVASPSK